MSAAKLLPIFIHLSFTIFPALHLYKTLQSYVHNQQDFLQVAKLLIALAALNILFATSTIENLMAGLYMLLSPLQLLGFNVERFTARLMLTLDYVEDLLVKNNYKFNFHQLDDIYTTPEDTCTEKEIVLVLPLFTLMDKVLMIVFIGSVLGLLLYRVLP